jgi:phage/plasmid primase-like uncharacterized protein
MTDDLRADILAALPAAVLPDTILPGRWHRFSSDGRRADRAGWLKVFPDQSGAVWGCWRAGLSESWSATKRIAMTQAQRIAHARQVMAATAERDRDQRQQWATNADRIARLWSECVPLVPGDPVTLYLKQRGLGGVWPLPGCLRLHHALPYWHDGVKLGEFPAMVAPLVTADDRLVALHRTYLTRDGRKADVPTVKKLTSAAAPLAGAAIPLHKTAPVIGISEGIESALSAAALSGVPTVAAYCADNLRAWRWPAGVRRIVIFSDHDKAGQAAAEALRTRVAATGLRCTVTAPSTPGEDWNDVLVAQRRKEMQP